MVEKINEDLVQTSRLLEEIDDEVEMVKGSIQFNELITQLGKKPNFSDVFD